LRNIEVFVQNHQQLDENDLMALYYFAINENFQNNIDNFEATEGADLKTEDEFNLRFSRVLTYEIYEPEEG
jgi:hypothetical protein